MKTPPKDTASGYTLIEVLVVVIIIGVLAAIAAPGWLAFMNQRRLTVARAEVTQAIRQAQSQARQRSLEQTVEFTGGDSPTVTVAGIPQVLGHGEIRPGLLNLTASTNTLTFDRRGNVKLNSTDTLADTAPIFKVTLAVEGSEAKQCVLIQTILGTIREGRNAECN